jgi:DNA-binding NarL/FixJ family response regulator
MVMVSPSNGGRSTDPFAACRPATATVQRYADPVPPGPSLLNGIERIVIRILIVDDRPATRAGLRMRLALEPDLAVVGEADSGEMATSLAARLAPDVVVLGLELPRLDGIEATAMLRQTYPGTAVVLLGLHDSDAVRTRAREAGAAAFVGKHELDEPLVAAIRRAGTASPPNV